MFTTTQSKKPAEFFFIDMNDPGRYKKLKVAKACELCRRRKSKCDLGVPGSGICSNCDRAGIKCVFDSQHSKKEPHKPSSPHPHPHPHSAATAIIDFSKPVVMFKDEHNHHLHHLHYLKNQQQQQSMVPAAYEWVQRIYAMFPLLDTRNIAANGVFSVSVPVLSNPPNPSTLESLETRLFEHYFDNIHLLYPVLDDAHGNSLTAVASMPAHQRSAVLALTCSLSYPDLTSLSAFYAQKAFCGLDTAVDLAAAQTLMLLYHYLETTLLRFPNNDTTPTQQSSHDASYLDRARFILSQLPQDDHHVARTQWLLYLHVCWAGYADTDPWKCWCLAQSYQSLSVLPGDLASFCRLTLTVFQHAPWLGDHNEVTPKNGTFDQHCALIQNMMVLPFEHVHNAERIEAHVHLLVGIMAQRAAIQSHHIILRALKASLHTYITFYAASLPLSDPATYDWICQRLANTMSLFEQLGAHPDLCNSVQDLIHHLSQ